NPIRRSVEGQTTGDRPSRIRRRRHGQSFTGRLELIAERRQLKSVRSLVSVSPVVNDLSADRGRAREAALVPSSDGLVGLFAIAALTLLAALFYTHHLPLIDRDEGRYAEGARE